MCLTRFAHLDLKFPFFLLQYACCDLYLNMHIATCNMGAICILRCNMDSFFLNQKGLVDKSILPKIFCNMHIAHRNMHIAIESILPLTHMSEAIDSITICILRSQYAYSDANRVQVTFQFA
jgi:hypothetical protein